MSASALPYHHGNLRNALIIAAAELIERDGTLDFAISEAAAMVGVSAAAPYRHFADKEDLLGAVRHLAFCGLAMWRSKPQNSTPRPLSRASWPWATCT